MPPYRSRRSILLGGSALIASMAGCSSDGDSATESNPSQSSTPKPTTSLSTTSKPIKTASSTSDLTIINQTDKSKRLSIRVSDQDGTGVFSETIEVGPGGRKRRDILAHDASGTFVITAQLPNGTEESYEWNLKEEPADGWISIYIESDSSLQMTYAIA